MDEVLILPFQAPASFTGEDVIEIHCHGGEYLTQYILDLCYRAGATPAEPGAFTKRAFLNGKLDLTQAESVLDMIQAQGERLLMLASQNLKSRTLGHYLETIRDALLQVQAPIVASVDFPDEVDEPNRQDLHTQLQALQTQVQAMVQSAKHNRMAREGFKVVILGPPNAGKSSLFNRLLANNRAIVTEIAGTTRDLLSETLVLEGIPITLMDTAGIRETENRVEVLGIERTWQASETADAILYLLEASEVFRSNSPGLPEEELAMLERLPPQVPTLIVVNKIDTLAPGKTLPTLLPPDRWADLLAISAQTGHGIPKLLEWLGACLQTHAPTAHDQQALAISLNHRQTQGLNAIEDCLQLATETLNTPSHPIDLVTVPLSDALYHLDKLLGIDTTESVLDEVFSRFCVGK